MSSLKLPGIILATSVGLSLVIAGTDQKLQFTDVALPSGIHAVMRYGGPEKPRLLFGLGTCAKIDHVIIRWPKGNTQVLNNVAVNK